MNIKIKDEVGFSSEEIFFYVKSLLVNRKPSEGNFNYGLETHGAIGVSLHNMGHPIEVRQTNKRKSDKSPIEITIKKHTPLF